MRLLYCKMCDSDYIISRSVVWDPACCGERPFDRSSEVALWHPCSRTLPVRRRLLPAPHPHRPLPGRRELGETEDHLHKVWVLSVTSNLLSIIYMLSVCDCFDTLLLICVSFADSYSRLVFIPTILNLLSGHRCKWFFDFTLVSWWHMAKVLRFDAHTVSRAAGSTSSATVKQRKMSFNHWK